MSGELYGVRQRNSYYTIWVLSQDELDGFVAEEEDVITTFANIDLPPESSTICVCHDNWQKSLASHADLYRVGQRIVELYHSPVRIVTNRCPSL